MAMTMEALNPFRKLIGKLIGYYTKSGTGSTGIVELGFDLRILGIDAQATGDGVTRRENLGIEALKLGEGIEGDVTAAPHNLGKVGLGISGRIGVGLTAKLLER